MQVTLLEATKKKCMFLEEVIADLQLGNVKVVWQRAEEAGTLASLREAGQLCSGAFRVPMHCALIPSCRQIRE